MYSDKGASVAATSCIKRLYLENRVQILRFKQTTTKTFETIMSQTRKKERNTNKRRGLFEVGADGIKAGIGFFVGSPRMMAGQTTTTTPSSSSSLRHRRRSKPGSDGDRELSPLEQALEIQTQDYGSGNSNSNSNRRREHHNRPAPVSRPSFSSPSSEFSSPSPQNRRTNKKNRTKHNAVDTRDQSMEKSSHMVDLCSSNSDTDHERDTKRRSKESPSSLSSSLSPRAQKMGTGSGGSKPESEGKRRRTAIQNERKRQEPSSLPKYPSKVHWADKDQNNDENYNETTKNDTSSFLVDLEKKKKENGNGDGDGDGNGDGQSGKRRKRKKKRGESQAKSEATAGSSFDLVEEHNSTNSGSWIDKTEERIQRKKPPPPMQSCLDRHTMIIPALKKIRTRKPYGSREKSQRKRTRHYDDVKDMDCSIEEDNVDNDCARAASTPYLADMKNVIKVAESSSNGIDVDADAHIEIDIDNYNDKVHSDVSTSRTLTNSSPRSSFMKNMKKVNTKGARAKTKVRKSSKIVPGASLMLRNNQQQQQNEEKLHWRSEKDEDEYHTSNKETQGTIGFHGEVQGDVYDFKMISEFPFSCYLFFSSCRIFLPQTRML